MRLELHDDGTLSGTFYNAEIQTGRWQTDRGRTCASFHTCDGSGEYYSAACLVDNEVQGQTWSLGRDFLFNWNATRAE